MRDNVRLAYKIASQWPRVFEAVGEAVLALCDAALGYDPAKGEFRHYAGRVVLNRMRKLSRRLRGDRLPDHHRVTARTVAAWSAYRGRVYGHALGTLLRRGWLGTPSSQEKRFGGKT